jgi:prepilin-type N-terminal cleavage/methylation domain-containing protein
MTIRQSRSAIVLRRLADAFLPTRTPSSAAPAVSPACNLSKGFTLLEMMAVVTLLAILSAPQIGNFMIERQSANTSKSIAQLSAIATKLQEYSDNIGACPATGNVDATTFGGAGNAYMPNPPVDPLVHTAYTIDSATFVSGACQFVLTAPGSYLPASLLNVPEADGTLTNTTDATLHFDSTHGGAYKSA